MIMTVEHDNIYAGSPVLGDHNTGIPVLLTILV